jgi:AcrR family transcriptional regulator
MPSAASGRQTREQILRAAMDTASVTGLSGLSIGVLADQLGMSKSGLFRHFGAKERLQLAAVDAAAGIFARDVYQPALSAEPGLDRLRALMSYWIRYLEGDTFPGGCFFAAASADMDSRPGPVRDRVAEVVGAGIAAIVAEIEAARELGQLREDVDPAQLAFQLHAYAMEVNWARQLLDDQGAGDRGRAAIEAALTIAGATSSGTNERDPR